LNHCRDDNNSQSHEPLGAKLRGRVSVAITFEVSPERNVVGDDRRLNRFYFEPA
jgi:hypothetical protein